MKELIIARKRSLRRLMFLHLSAILFTGGGVRGRGHAWWGCAWRGVGGVHGGGHAWQGGHACHVCPPHPDTEIQSISARAVLILLECILVEY